MHYNDIRRSAQPVDHLRVVGRRCPFSIAPLQPLTHWITYGPSGILVLLADGAPAEAVARVKRSEGGGLSDALHRLVRMASAFKQRPRYHLAVNNPARRLRPRGWRNGRRPKPTPLEVLILSAGAGRALASWPRCRLARAGPRRRSTCPIWHAASSLGHGPRRHRSNLRPCRWRRTQQA